MNGEAEVLQTYQDELISANVETCKATLTSIAGGGRPHITSDEHVRAKEVAVQHFNDLSDSAWTKVCSPL